MRESNVFDMEDDFLQVTLASTRPRFFTPDVEAVCSSVLSEKFWTGSCEGHYFKDNSQYFKDNSHKDLNIQIFECFTVHYNQSTLTIRVAADGSGEQSGTCRP
jgi:hypothetical protein